MKQLVDVLVSKFWVRISDKALQLYNERAAVPLGGLGNFIDEEYRSDPILIDVVKELGSESYCEPGDEIKIAQGLEAWYDFYEDIEGREHFNPGYCDQPKVDLEELVFSECRKNQNFERCMKRINAFLRSQQL